MEKPTLDGNKKHTLKYYTYYIHPATMWYQVLQATWTGSFVDYKRKKNNMMFDTHAEADRACKSRLEIMVLNNEDGNLLV